MVTTVEYSSVAGWVASHPITAGSASALMSSLVIFVSRMIT
jgi:hypothetical protein